MGYLKHTIIGTTWVSAFRISTRAISFFRILILARILSPANFGVFGIAALVLSFLEILTETGINIFLVQKKGSIDRYISDAWIVSILRGFILFLLLILLSPFIANFFNSPNAIQLLQLISFVPLIRGFINPAVVKYQKNLEFGKDFYFHFAIFALDSLIVIGAAYITKSPVSFVYGLMAGALLEVILSFVFLKPRPTFSFRVSYLKEILHSGKWVTLFGLFNFISQKGDNVVVGRLLGTTQLGIYEMGYNLSTLPISEISDVVNKVVFPIYVNIKKDRARLRRAVLKTMSIITLAVLAFSSFIFFLPREFFLFLLGPKWEGVYEIIKVLAFYGLFRAILGTTASLFLALGKQKYVAVMTFVRVTALLIVVVPLTSMFGLIGTSFAALISVIAEIPIVVYFIYKIVKKHL